MNKFDAIANIMDEASKESIRHAYQNASRTGFRTLGEHASTVITAATGDEWSLPYPKIVEIDKCKGKSQVRAFLIENLERNV